MIHNDNEPKSYEINGSNYKLFAHNVCQTQSMSEKLTKLGVNSRAPTLVLTECLLIYLEPQDARNIISWTRDFFSDSPFVGILNYEMIEPDDTFGRKMIENLKDRGCELKGILGCPNMQAQEQRMLESLAGGDHKVQAECVPMDKVYE